MAPATMLPTLAATLAPWQTLGASGRFMDDRSLVAKSPEGLQADIDITVKFDTDVGYTEHTKKR